MKEQICLCTRHLQDYIQASMRYPNLAPKRDYTERVKDTCEHCDKLGWVYTIERDKHAK